MSKELSRIAKVWELTLKKTQSSATKRSTSLFTTMSVAHVDDEDDDLGIEKIFPNSEVYKGQWSGESPNGTGEYLWSDGCIYLGDWLKGKPMGKGKFTWPSGAVYDGDFKNGYMDGEGTFTGSTSDTYKGSWSLDLRHGNGIRIFENGDQYDGQWRRGLPDGKGMYQWSNGNQYIGQWKQGKMHGAGTMVWSNGNHYDGNWQDGYPKGNGKFRWDDGSFYIGVWSDDPEEQSGTYYPSSSPLEGGVDWDPREVLSVALSDCIINHGEKITLYPSQKLYNWPVEGSKHGSSSYSSSDGRVRRASIDGSLSSSVHTLSSESDSFGSSDCLGSVGGRDLDGGIDEISRGFRRPSMITKPAKQQGQIIAKGHKHYELMLNLQLGIRHAVGRPAPASSFLAKATAFDTKDKVWTRFPTEGSKHTPPHQSCEFKWKDYCPSLFRTLRKLFKVDPADYMISICGNDALRELSSPGKSGSFFYLTSDDKYMIKTMKKSEVKVLRRMLPAYFHHVKTYENTLVTKFFGLHCVKLIGPAQKKVRFVIMGNLFRTNYAIHRRFDLKGSSHGRLTMKPESEIDSTTTLKDLDLNFIFRLPNSWFKELCRQVDHDADFLEKERIMDYSLLVGIHFREIGNQTSEASPTSNMDSFDSEWTAPVSLGANMPARAELTIRKNTGEPQLIGEPTGEYVDVILVFGIIDILQDYDISKKLEHAYKSFHHDPTSISAVDPRQYSKRFRDFIFRVFTEDT